jgi:hypothetical protein
MLIYILAFFFKDKKIILFTSIISITLTTILITLSYIIIIAASFIAINTINKASAKINLVANKGISFYIIS